jgi:hypothetical protein
MRKWILLTLTLVVSIALLANIKLTPDDSLAASSSPAPTYTLPPRTTATITPTAYEINPLADPFSRPIFDIAIPVPQRVIDPSDTIGLQRFELFSAVSGFHETMEPFGAVGMTAVQTFSADPFMPYIRAENCAEEIKPFLPRLTPVLQNYARDHGKSDLMQYIETEEQVGQLFATNPQVARELIPPASEWQQLSDADYEEYINWLTICSVVGFPVFDVTVENLTNQEQRITQVLYRTSRIATVMGGAYGPLLSSVTYIHEIDWIPGDQVVSLVPPFKIPPQSTAHLSLIVTTTVPDWGMCWLMTIYFIDQAGNGVHTDEFQLIMSGLPVPGM